MTNPGWFPTLQNASQEKLVKYFESHKSEFENVITELRSGVNAAKIQTDLKKLGLCGQFVPQDKCGQTYLYLYKDDIWVGAGYYKGFAYSLTEPTPLVNDIDKAGSALYCKTIFQKIDVNWYLFFYFY
jgi:hypothetical protein